MDKKSKQLLSKIDERIQLLESEHYAAECEIEELLAKRKRLLSRIEKKRAAKAKAAKTHKVSGSGTHLTRSPSKK